MSTEAKAASYQGQSETRHHSFAAFSVHATKCVDSLFANAAEYLEVCFMTDSAADKDALNDVIRSLPNPNRHSWHVVDDSEAEVRAKEQWASLPNLRTFRRGHPCWRKVTDPLLFSCDADEMVILDPDLYFPNRFTFEPTPRTGIRLMWQHPNRMLPASTVHAALSASIALARHVDIGVAQWRASQDLEWFDWMIGKLGGPALPGLCMWNRSFGRRSRCASAGDISIRKSGAAGGGPS